MNRIDVFIADDHNLFRNGLKMLLLNYPHINICGEASNGKECAEAVDLKIPDIILMDIDMPLMNGIEATKNILEKHASIKIISLSMYGEEEYYYKMIESGAKGFLLKNSDITEVVKAIDTVQNGGSYFSPDVLYNVVKSIDTSMKKQLNNATFLSEREKEVLEQICKGLSNQEIAEVLYISKRTVEKHRASLLSKTNSKNTANLVMYAIENKMVDL